MYTLYQTPAMKAERVAFIHYVTPCDKLAHVCAVLDIGTDDARVLFATDYNGKPISANTIRAVNSLIAAYGKG